jgi:hypothetical protein
MKYSLPVSLLCLILLSCEQPESSSDSAAFVTLLGEDTLAVEQFQKNGNRITAQVILRSPETTLATYELQLDDQGGIEEMLKREHSSGQGFESEGEVTRTITRNEDNLIVESETEEGSERDTVGYEAGALPFIDMVHWPFEPALNRAMASSQDSLSQPLLAGSQLSDFVIAKIATDSMTIRHPFRGVMGVTVDERGNIRHLNAGQTTRKVDVRRVSQLDIHSLGQRFASMDQQGSPFGELSRAESELFTIGDAEFRIEYGSPRKRGRTIFGEVVPWGEVWRTGANRATHFRTSHDLRIGNLDIPAGEYTLFTIPEEDGGTLMINEETGINGQAYDEENDLGRVPMQIDTRPEVTEQFTIEVEGSGEDGVLNLIWDQTVFSIDFEILE